MTNKDRIEGNCGVGQLVLNVDVDSDYACVPSNLIKPALIRLFRPSSNISVWINLQKTDKYVSL